MRRFECAMGAGLFLVLTACADEGPASYRPASPLELVAAPQQFRSSKVYVGGYISVSGDSVILYPTKEFSEAYLIESGIHLDIKPNDSRLGCTNCYAYVRGVFHVRPSGHLGVYKSQVSQIVAVEEWDVPAIMNGEGA